MRHVDHSNNVLRDHDRIVQDVLTVFGAAAQSRAQDLARRDTGNMANAIFVDKSDLEKWTVYIVAPVEYSIYNELGTRFTPAQPFMVPGTQAQLRPMRAVLKKKLGVR